MGPEELAARNVLKTVLANGEPPPNGFNPSSCGELADVVRGVLDGYAAGGTDKARSVWVGLCNADSGLNEILSGGDGPQPRSRLYRAAEALEPQPPIDWIVDDLFSAGSVNMVYGLPGAKKTWVILDMAVCVARGESWLGKETKECDVLIVDEESGRRRMFRRLSDSLMGHQATPQTPIWFTALEGLNFTRAEDLEELKALIEVTGVGLVVIDSLAAATLGADENSVKDIQPVFQGLRMLADSNQVAVVVIHHSGKSGHSYRGSSSIGGGVDLVLQVDSKPSSPNVDFTVEKCRDGAPGSFAATAHFEPGCFYLTESEAGADVQLPNGQRYVLDYLEKNGKTTRREIADNADICAAKTALNSLDLLCKLGRVRRCNAGGRGKEAVYELAQGDQDELEQGSLGLD